MPLNEKQQKARIGRIGGSEAAAAIGLSNYRSKLDLWLEKTERKEESPPTRAALMGNRLESIICDWFIDEVKEQYGLTAELKKTNESFKRFDFMIAHVDTLADIKETNSTAIVEAKSSGFGIFASPAMLDLWQPSSCPIDYFIQCHHYMAVLDLNECFLAAWTKKGDFLYRFERDSELEKMIIEGEREFHEKYLKPDIAPEIDSSEECTKYLRTKYTQSTYAIDPANSDETRLALQYRKYASEIEKLEKKLTKTKNELIDLIGNRDGIVHKEFKITHKAIKETDWESVVKAMNLEKNNIERFKSYDWRKAALTNGAKQKLIDKFTQPSKIKRFLPKFN